MDMSDIWKLTSCLFTFPKIVPQQFVTNTQIAYNIMALRNNLDKVHYIQPLFGLFQESVGYFVVVVPKF